MFCVIQEIRRKKPDSGGEYREIEAYQVPWTIEGKEPVWDWRYTGGHFDRPHLEEYKISLHQSYRENGKVKKRQCTVCTMSYYDFCSTWWGDCIVGGELALAEKLGTERICTEVETTASAAAYQPDRIIWAVWPSQERRFPLRARHNAVV